MKTFAKIGWVLIAAIAMWLTGPLTFSAAQDIVPVTKVFEETSYYLKDVTFIDANTGWAVGDVHWDQAQRNYLGTIITTSDGGVTWTPQSAGANELLNAVTFVDAATGWAVGARGTILHTTDGGQTWTRQAVDTADEFRDVAFADASTGWAVAMIPTTISFDGEASDWNASLWHTRDGGQTWQRQPLPDTASILHGVDAVDALTSWAVGSQRAEDEAFGRQQHAGVIYHTADGGATWTEQLSVDEFSFTAVDFVDPLHGWAVGFATNSGGDQRAIFHTTNSGQTWERQEPGSTFAPLWDVQFIDQNQGYAVGADYASAWGPPVFRTIDGGATWESIRMKSANPLSVEGLQGVAVVGNRVVAVGDHDFIATTRQAWESPQQDASGMPCDNFDCLFEQHYLNPHYIFHDVFFTNDLEGWVVGSKTFSVTHWGQVIFHTVDGGQTWQTQYEHAPDMETIGGGLFSYHRLDDVTFADQSTGWAVGTSARFFQESRWVFEGAILRTTDGGITWQESAAGLYDDQEREFFAVDFVDALDGWALATRSSGSSPNVALARTSDGGVTWQWVDTGVEGIIQVGFASVLGDIDFSDAQHGWATGGLGTIAHTSNGGATWTQQILDCGSSSCRLTLYAVEMIDAETGWIAGEAASGLFGTTNGGQSWSAHPIRVSGHYVYDLQFLDAQYGWLAGDDGQLMRTTDGGMTWQAIPTREDIGLNGLHFVAPDLGWVVGDYGVILRCGT